MAMFHSLPSIHVKHQKNTAELESVIMPVPAEVTISMSQHIGALQTCRKGWRYR